MLYANECPIITSETSPIQSLIMDTIHGSNEEHIYNT